MKGIKKILHYLILMAKDEQSATLQKDLLVTSFQSLGVPIEQSKLEGPAKCLTSGIEVDTSTLQLCLPQGKLQNVRNALSQCVLHKTMTKRNLQSLTGLL